MSNDERALTGLRPFKSPAGTGSPRITYYKAWTSKDIYRYQPVSLTTNGSVTVSPILDASGILGVALGFLDGNMAGLPTDMNSLTQGAYYKALGGNCYVAVCDDPYQLYISEMDTGGSVVGSADSAGQTLKWTYTASTGDTTTGNANLLLDQSDVAADTGGVLTLVRPYVEYTNADGTANDVTANFSKWIVRINRSQAAPIVGYVIGERPGPGSP